MIYNAWPKTVDVLFILLPQLFSAWQPPIPLAFPSRLTPLSVSDPSPVHAVVSKSCFAVNPIYDVASHSDWHLHAWGTSLISRKVFMVDEH